MRRQRYPLEPLGTLRDAAVDAAVRGLAGAVRARAVAEDARRAMQERQDAHDREAARVRSVEAEALARGELRAGDLASAGAWELRVAVDGSTLAADVERARKAEAAAQAAQDTAKGTVAARQADARVVEKDEERWEQARRAKGEAREEEEAAEAYRPRR
jgi:hypothetical protein